MRLFRESGGGSLELAAGLNLNHGWLPFSVEFSNLKRLIARNHISVNRKVIGSDYSFLAKVASVAVGFPPMNGSDLSTSDVAARFGVSPITARLWCRRGLFPNAYEHPTPRGPVWMIPPSDLKGFDPPKKTGRPPKSATNGTARKKKAEPSPSSDGLVVVTRKRAAKKSSK